MDLAPIHILLVEDNPADAQLVQIALDEIHEPVNLHTVRDGQDAISFLKRRPPFSQAPQPAMIFLDLNMPRMRGHECLKEIKSDPELKAIPVIVLTTSDAETDIRVAYELGANCYVTKPSGYEAFLHTMQAIHDFWFRTASLPHR